MTNPIQDTPESSNPLDKLLSESGEYIADNGFCARVIAALPPHRQRRSWRAALLGCTLILCGCLAVRALPSLLTTLGAARFGLGTLNIGFLPAWILVIATIGSLVWGALALTTEQE